MPSMISSAIEFRPLRWVAAVVVLVIFAFGAGVIYGTDQVSAPQPACTAPR